MTNINSILLVVVFSLTVTSCKIPVLAPVTTLKPVPNRYQLRSGSANINTGTLKWRTFFKDPNLVNLIDSALKNNQELNIMTQEIEIARNEIRARRGEYLPFVNGTSMAGLDKVGRYTREGASESNLDIKPGTATPEPLTNFMLGPVATWEVDIWHKLRNAQKAAIGRYLATIEGKNFMVTNLISEIAQSYYELLALDNEQEILRQNIQIQTDALEIVKVQKEAARVTELAVKRFEAQVLHTRNLQYEIAQQIIETENHINFLRGTYQQPVIRNSASFTNLVPDSLSIGLPAQLLENRPDVRQAEFQLEASKLDVKSARANFYPSLRLSAGLGFNAFSLAYLVNTPASLIYSLGGEFTGPLINRNGITAMYKNANARQIQALNAYQKTILTAFIEVSNQISSINNLEKSYSTKEKEVQALAKSVTIANNLFSSAHADYMEVLLTQRDALESRFQLLETKQKQLHAVVQMYRALGGGWN